MALQAASLAMRYGADINNAILAGMLVAVAKCLTNEKKICICEKYNISNQIPDRQMVFAACQGGRLLAMKKIWRYG